MRAVINEKKIEGSKPIPDTNGRASYIATKNYILMEFKREELGYEDYYLRPVSDDSYAIYTHVPELQIIEHLKDSEASFRKFLVRSSKTAGLILNPSKEEQISIVLIDDFTDGNKRKVWCFKMLVKQKLTNEIFKDGSNACNTLVESLNKLFDVMSEFYTAYNEQQKDITAQTWIEDCNPKITANAIKLCEDKEFFPPFIRCLTNVSDKEMVKYFKKEKVLLSIEKKTYTFRAPVDEEDLTKNAILMVMADVFAPSLKDTDYFFVVNLDYIDGKWRPGVELDDYYEFVSGLMEHVDKKNNKKMSKNALKLMRNTSFIWFYSNNNNNGYDLDKYVNDNDSRRIYDVAVPPIKVTGKKLRLWSLISPDPEDIWDDGLFLGPCALVINEGCEMIKETWDYFPIFIKEVGISVLSNLGKGASIGLNPVGYFIKKGLKKK